MQRESPLPPKKRWLLGAPEVAVKQESSSDGQDSGSDAAGSTPQLHNVNNANSTQSGGAEKPPRGQRSGVKRPRRSAQPAVPAEVPTPKRLRRDSSSTALLRQPEGPVEETNDEEMARRLHAELNGLPRTSRQRQAAQCSIQAAKTDPVHGNDPGLLPSC